MLPQMPSFTLDAEIAVEPQVLFDALTTPARLERWLYGTEVITELSGPLAVQGTTFVQRAMKGIQRPGGVVASDPPRLWHVRLVGFGERAELVFELEPIPAGTHLRLTVDVRNRPRVLGPIVDRLSAPIERRLWRRVMVQIRDEMALDALRPVPGGVYVLEGGGWLRIGQVIEADDRHVHLELRPGVCHLRPARMSEIDLAPRGLRSYFDLRPLDPTVRSAAAVVPVGSRAMLADGGFGLAHCALTITEFRNARPELIDQAPVQANAGGRVAFWRAREGAAFGEPRAPIVGALFSVALQPMGVDAIGFGVVKLLRQQIRGVHVRVFSNTYPERPTTIDEAQLTFEAVDPERLPATPPTAPIAIGHLPLGHGAFTTWQPQLVATALVDPEELVGYETWQLGKGGFF